MPSDPSRAEFIRSHIHENYRGMFREPCGILTHPFLVPGSASYDNVLWDWDSYFADVALRQILLETEDPELSEEALKYELGCVLNYLDFTSADGWMPIVVPASLSSLAEIRPENVRESNMHKPVIAQHAAFLSRCMGGDAEWLRSRFEKIQFFHNAYRNHFRHRATGLYFWADDTAIGVDNDPCTYYRPKKSSASIYLNCLMYRELLAGAYLAERLNLPGIQAHYLSDAEELRTSVRTHCFDNWTGFYYSCDLNLRPIDFSVSPGNPHDGNETPLHCGQPRDWDCLLMRIGVWSGFLAMWSGIASKQEAARMVECHYRDPEGFSAPFGIRTLAKYEPMYNLRASGNPSSRLGPVWGISNYLVWRGLLNYGYETEAGELAEKTISLFGRDLERFGALHEYYDPETGEPILNRGFQNWNYLVLNMIAHHAGRMETAEF